MNKLTIIMIAVCTVFLSIFVFVTVGYISAHNYSARAENDIVATYDELKVVRSAYVTKIQEMAQINDMYKDDLTEVYTAVLGGRYGPNGSQAMMQWIKEVNPNFDSGLYKNLQTVMEAGANEFKVSQSLLIDKKRQYQTNQDYFMKGIFIRMTGYPKINLDDYELILAKHTQQEFKSGNLEVIKLR